VVCSKLFDVGVVAFGTLENVAIDDDRSGLSCLRATRREGIRTVMFGRYLQGD